MNCRSLLENWGIAIPLLVCLVLAGPAIARAADGNDHHHPGFAFAGVALGMDFDTVRKIHPTATTEETAASCYSYGRAVSRSQFARRTLRLGYQAGTLSLGFQSPVTGGGLTRIHYDGAVGPSAAGVRKLLASLSARYGPYDRILYRRKMEPAGRIIGFEWQARNGSTLRVVLRHEYSNGGDDVRMSILARSRQQVPRPASRALSPACGLPGAKLAGRPKPPAHAE